MDAYNAMKRIRKVHHSKSSKEKVFNDSKKMDKDFYYDVLKVNVNIMVKENINTCYMFSHRKNLEICMGFMSKILFLV